MVAHLLAGGAGVHVEVGAADHEAGGHATHGRAVLPEEEARQHHGRGSQAGFEVLTCIHMTVDTVRYDRHQPYACTCDH